MAGVFISYRREDAPGHAGRVYDRVRAKFGADIVFMDVTAIDAGADFVEAIEQAVGACDVLLAIIGPQWAGAKDNAGRRRLENANDFIRLEIAGALKRNVRVVPVLVDDATLPAPADLPDDLQPLLRRNAVELRDARWDADIEQLLASLERIVKPREAPLRLEAVPRSRWLVRALAALAVVAMAVGAAVYGPRACAPAPGPATPTTTASTAVTPAGTPRAETAQPPAAATETPREPAPSRPTRSGAPSSAPLRGSGPEPSTPKATLTVPDVVGRSLSDAREILRRAGVEVARVLYRDDRTKAIDLVVVQTDVRTSAGSPPAVALTAVARAAVVISHLPEDGDMARRLLGALTASKATAGLAVRTLEMQALRPDSIAHVAYSEGALADTAADLARDATSWLEQNDPGRPALAAAFQPRAASRTILIGIPERRSTTSTTAPLPDVRGLTFGDARRKLSAAGVTAFDYKWSTDGSRKPFEVFGQTELPARAGGRMVGLEVEAKGTLVVFHLADDAPIVSRFARDLQASLNMYGILVRPVRQSAVKPEMVGKVSSADALAREARLIATFTSSWFDKELGRSLRIEAVKDLMSPKEIMLGFPSLR